MKSFDVVVSRRVEDIVPVFVDSHQEAEAHVMATLEDDDSARIVDVTVNEFWTEAFNSGEYWPLYDSEGCYLERE